MVTKNKCWGSEKQGTVAFELWSHSRSCFLVLLSDLGIFLGTKHKQTTHLSFRNSSCSRRLSSYIFSISFKQPSVKLFSGVIVIVNRIKKGCLRKRRRSIWGKFQEIISALPFFVRLSLPSASWCPLPTSPLSPSAWRWSESPEAYTKQQSLYKAPTLILQHIQPLQPTPSTNTLKHSGRILQCT